jgi:hypothetical protein
MKRTKQRGRPRGTSKAFGTDPDRHLIALTDALLISNPNMKFEHAAMFAIYFHRRERVGSPTDPLQTARRLGLSAAVQKLLREGWFLQQWGPADRANRDVIGSRVDRLRKKAARIADDPAAKRWRFYMSMAWVSLLSKPSVGVIEAAIKQAGEVEYFQTVMLPFTKLTEPN